MQMIFLWSTVVNVGLKSIQLNSYTEKLKLNICRWTLNCLAYNYLNIEVNIF